MAKGKNPETPDGKPITDQQGGALASDRLDQRRRNLELELARHSALIDPDRSGDGHEIVNQSGQAVKLSSEFLAGVVVGIVLGLGFDKLLNTSPWGLIVFVLLGFLAGVLNVLRSIGRIEPSKIGQNSTDQKAKKPR